MIVRIRSRDGVERVDIREGANVGDLYAAVATQLKIPLDDLRLSKNPDLLLTGATAHQFGDLVKRGMSLQRAKVENGTMVYALYSGERTVAPVYRKSKFEERLFGKEVQPQRMVIQGSAWLLGKKMTIEDMVAQQVRIERQEKATAASISFDHRAANEFQSYVRSALAFSIKRGGLLYGTVDEENNIRVEFVYEPRQHATQFELLMERQTDDEQHADLIAESLGLKKVGWIFAQSSEERDFIVSAEELRQMAAIQAEIGETSVTAIVSLDMSEDEGHVHFEAYQCSKQCVSLWQKNWFSEDPGESMGVIKMKNPDNLSDKTPVIVVGKDVAEVDNDFFLCPVNILDHQGFLECGFPVENRVLSQGRADLKKALTRDSSVPYQQKLADFHLLLFLAAKLDRNDLATICLCIRNNEPILEGYRFLIDSLAEL